MCKFSGKDDPNYERCLARVVGFMNHITLTRTPGSVSAAVPTPAPSEWISFELGKELYESKGFTFQALQ